MNWDLAGESERSQVVMPAAVLHVHFETRQCLSVDAAGRPCKGQLTADGREIGVLRKTRTLAFAHELLYQWADKLLSGSAETWSSAWLMALVRARNISEADKQRLWEQHKKQFAEATLDFIQLQGIDYDSGFACDCWQGTACQHIMDQSSRPQQILIALHLAADGITMDGIAMCFHKNQARIVSPAAAPAEPTEPLVHGASFRDRIFVPDQALRGPLLRFAHRGMFSSCSCACQQIALLDASMAYPLPGAVDELCWTAGEGLAVEELDDLKQQLEALLPGSREQLLLPLLEVTEEVTGQQAVHAEPHSASLLACLATTAPVSQLLRPSVANLVQQLLQVRGQGLFLHLPRSKCAIADAMWPQQLSCQQTCPDCWHAQDQPLSLQQEMDLQRACPLLYHFLQPQLMQPLPLPPPVKALLQAISQVTHSGSWGVICRHGCVQLALAFMPAAA